MCCFVDISELVHCGRKLKDDLTLDACGIQSGATIHILKRAWPEPESSPGLLIFLTVIVNISAGYLNVCVSSTSEPVNRATAAREFRVFHAALHSLNSAYRDSVSQGHTVMIVTF